MKEMTGLDSLDTYTEEFQKLVEGHNKKEFDKKWLAEKRGYTVLILRSWKIEEDLQKMFITLNFTEEEKCKFA